MKNKFLVFGFDEYYPVGGWNDFIGAVETLDDAKQLADEHNYAQIYEIVDVESLIPVLGKSTIADWHEY